MANKLFLIALNNYIYQDSLSSSVKDITDFKNILLEKFDFEEKNVYELINENATSIKIQDAFRGYIKSLSEDDNLIIYYSGHGEYNNESDIGYWIPYEAIDYTNFLANNIITAYLEKIRCKHIFVVSDSCFSNSLLQKSTTKNISEYFEKKSRWALTSAFHEAKDSEPDSNTLFAEILIETLEGATKNIRVTEIIETIKKQFEINAFQTPQGSPLQINGHEGGEFIFNIRQQIDKRKLKGYVDFRKILELYKRNSNFSELSTFEDKSNKIGYQLFEEVDAVVKKSTNYLYLYEGINQTRTLAKLKAEHPNIFIDKNLVVFIPTEKDQVNIDIRKKNIDDKFKPISLFYIDDFIREHCTPKVIYDDDSKFLNISNFILPIVKQESAKASGAQHYLDQWYYQDNDPILVIKGSGGIGKTTLAYYYADKLIQKHPSHYVLFIDSILIKDSLLKNKNRGNLNLYNFYEALFDITDHIFEKLSEELFQLNVDAGNILVIIDGLDEVISKIPNFNVSEFLESIKSSTADLGNGKVIITCRTYFWDTSNFENNHFSVIELEPFSEDQTTEFFNKSFGEYPSKIIKSLKLANDFKFPTSDGKHIYHPYVLDIIRSIIESEEDTINFDLSDLNSEYLFSDIKNDYITYRVCDREIRRVGQISVDEQIKFFIFLSVNKRGTVKTLSLQNEIENSLGRSVSKTNVEAFKAHPFLKCIDTATTFKYDFLADLFKSVYISQYFNTITVLPNISQYFTDIVGESCWFGSALNFDITSRIKQWDIEGILIVSDLITQAKELHHGNLVNKIIANIFSLALDINHKFKPNNIINNTELLKNIFEIKSNQIEGLMIINVNAKHNLTFDFTNLEITNAVINNYNNFWECKFDGNSKFLNCELLHLNEKLKNSELNQANFIDCTFDSSLEKSLSSITSNKEEQSSKVKVFLQDFFHLFVSNGRLGRQWEHKVIEPRFNGINKCNVNYKKFIQLLKKQKILVITEELKKVKFEIHNDYKEDVQKYIKDGTMSTLIASIAMGLS
jgi:hypothetical protein